MTELAPTDAAAIKRRIETQFGSFDVAEEDIVHFAEGLPGFEQCHRFVVLSSPSIEPLHCLHSIEGPGASFLAVDPRGVLPNYRSELSEADRVKLKARADAPLVWLALVTVDETHGPSVNLRAPVVINPARMIGYQVMPHNSLYPLRHPLSAE
jgi:flagellar assembly factor FliW